MHCAQVAIKFMQRGEKLASVYVEREIINHSILLHPPHHPIQAGGVSRAKRACAAPCVLSLLLLLQPPCHKSQGLRKARCCCMNSLRVPCMQVFLTPDYLAIAMEYASGGDMFQFVKNRRGPPSDMSPLPLERAALPRIHARIVCQSWNALWK